MKQLSFLWIILLSSLSNTSLQAQSWQWGQRGGSSIGSAGSGANEYARDVATDVNGNVYVLARNVGANALTIAGTPRTVFGSYDVMLASFTCDGQLRWSKIIGCTREDDGFALQTDSKGGVYFAIVASMFSGAGTNTLNFDTDKILTVPNTQGGKCYKTVFLAKYDTSGNFQWVKSPQSDTVGVYAVSHTAILSIDVDDQGVVHCLSTLPTGIFEGSYIVNKQGTYILKYAANGNFIGGVAPGINVTRYSLNETYFKIDKKLDRYLISGTVDFDGPVYIGDMRVKGGKYLAVFDNTGKLLWDRQDTSFVINNGITNRTALDDSSNIYIAVNTRKGNDFNGYISHGTTSSTVMLMKMDKDGNLLWASNANFTSAVIFSYGIALRNSGEVILTGANVGLTKWGTYGYIDSITTPDATYRPFIARFNTHTGKLLDLEDLVATGNNSYPADIVSDGRNSVFIGGELGGKLTVNGKTLVSAGGSKDFFVAKYGYANCNCTNIPEPEFTHTASNHFNYSFNYTGTAATTYEWDFGDGNTSTQQSPSHTYTSPDDFIACVKVTNNCGDNIYCTKISTKWPATVTSIGEDSKIRMYPNPANDVLYVEGVESGSRIELYNMLGVKAHEIITAREKEAINISYLPYGNYIIQLTDNRGKRMTGKVVVKR